MVENDFAQMVKKELERRGFEVIIAPVLKNNGLKLTGITIKTDQASPTLYLDSVPEEHRNPFMVPRIADEMIEAFQRFEGSSVVDGIGDLMGSKPELMKRIMPRLVNYEWNVEMLPTLPHRRFLDLAITYDIDLGNHASCRVRKEMKLGVSEDELYQAAMKNAHERGYQINRMDEIIRRGLDVIVIPDEMPDMHMLVVTNKSGCNGSYAMIDDELLEQIREKVGEFYILPSSIHELIIVSKNASMNAPETVTAEHLRELVRAVTRESLSREEWLSDSVYKYDGEARMA